ncbi:MAG: YARHG domain-containing protein [Clostridia bacterium]|nr:YARHG domain-containing protein [Clostridia bacterium]
MLFINQPTADEPIPETEIEVTEETEAPQEEPLDVPEEEEIPAEQEPEPEPEPTEEAPKEPEPAQKTVRNITRNNYLFPSDSKYLTESDVNGLSQFDTGLIRNEIYAKKGYVFKDEPYKSYFNSQAWYNPNPSAKMRLNEIEKYNVNFLLEYERSQGWR